MTVTVRLRGEGVPRLRKAMRALGGKGKARRAYRMAVNKVGRRAYTQTKRAVAKQVGLSQARTVAAGNLRQWMASDATLEHRISSSGEYLGLKHFGARQFSYGVRAKPWGVSRRFPGAFMGPRPGVISQRLGGQVFKREGSSRLPIAKLYGPAVPRELVQDASRDAWEEAAEGLQPEVERQIRRLAGKAL